jgi:hypothetical protein
MLTSQPSESVSREFAGLIVFCVLIYVVWCGLAPLVAKLAVHS